MLQSGSSATLGAGGLSSLSAGPATAGRLPATESDTRQTAGNANRMLDPPSTIIYSDLAHLEAAPLAMRRELLSALTLLAALAGCPGSGAGIGDPCGANDDCNSSAQCLNGRCARRCERAPECGDGYACLEGACVAAHESRGDTCFSEVDCIAGLTCQLNGAQADPVSNRLTSSCQPENAIGRSTGAACHADEDCRNGACDLGHCVDVCRDSADCPAGTDCRTVPHASVGGQLYSGCMKSSGVVTWDIPVASPTASLLLPVPSGAVSAELVMSVDDPSQKVGAQIVLDPCGCTQYSAPCDFFQGEACDPLRAINQYYSRAPSAGSPGQADNSICAPVPRCDSPDINRIRHLPAFGRSVLLMPSIPQPGELRQGAYTVNISTFWPDNSQGSAIPRVTAVVRVSAGETLDLHFFFLDLTDHPCSALPDGAALSAGTAPTGAFHDDYLGTLKSLFARNHIQVNDASYENVANRHALDGLDIADLGALFSLGRHATGINVFFVRSLSPLGVEVFGPNPGPGGVGGTPESGIVVSLDTLCYRDWPAIARLTAHAIARYMGLYHNVELRDPRQAPDDPRWEDLIPDSDSSDTNLMYPSARDGDALSIGQRNALTWSPVLQ